MVQRTGVLFLAWWVLCSLLLTGMAVAQTEGELPGPGPTEGCADPQEVTQFAGSTDRRTNPFSVTGDVLRLRFSTVETGEFGGTFDIDVYEANGDYVDSITVVQESTSDTQNILLPKPGAYYLEIFADDMNYELAVDDCGTVDADGPDNDDADGPDDDQYGDDSGDVDDKDDVVPGDVDDKDDVVPGDVDDKDDVILDPILEDKKLVNTGGIPLVAVAGLLLACATGLFVRVLRG
jgi:hypothetical protein